MSANSKNTPEAWQAKMIKAVPFVMAVVFAAMLSAQESGQQTFTNPQDAGKALYAAVKSGDTNSIEKILGPSSAPLLSSGDQVQDKNNQDDFVRRYDQMNRWSKETIGDQTLLIGVENWPFPIPLKSNAGKWFFETKAGVEEMLLRRVGRNELATIGVCQALSDAQQHYFAETHDGDTVHQYAQKIISDEGKQNGLYWKASEGQPESPIGPLIASATAEGYGGHPEKLQAFHGYFYKVLTAQGGKAQGGAKSYIVEGKMTGGFAFVAWPAEYRNSGVMTFVVNRDGVVYQKDLGPQTADVASGMSSYRPDTTWVVAEEEDDSSD